MKKEDLFTTTFLKECELQLQYFRGTINSVFPFAHPDGDKQSEVLFTKIMYNRVLFLLYKAGKRTLEEFVAEIYLID